VFEILTWWQMLLGGLFYIAVLSVPLYVGWLAVQVMRKYLKGGDHDN